MIHRYRIDTHQHIVPDGYRAALERVGITGSGERAWPDWSVDSTLELMDRAAIETAVVSIASPGTYFGDIEFTKRLVRECNDEFARLMGDRPSRFGAFGLVPLPDVNAALRELEYALDVLRLDGITLLTHVGNRYLGQPEYEEFYAELDRRQAVVFVHPVRPSMECMPEMSFPAGLTELVFDTTRAITNLLYTGTLAKYPRIRFIMAHGGGATPFLLFRLSHMEKMPQVRDRIPHGVVAHLKRLYYDVAQSAAPVSLRALADLADPSHILFGSDYPFAVPNAEKILIETIEGISNFEGFDVLLRRKVERDNALALFPRLRG